MVIYFHDVPKSPRDKLIEEGIVLNVAGEFIIEHPLILPYLNEVVGETDNGWDFQKHLHKG